MGQGRYFRRGKTKVIWLTAAPANLDAPTIAELDAGTDLSIDIASISGFGMEEGTIPLPDLADAYTEEIGGEQTAVHGQTNLYENDESATIKNALAFATEGYIAILPEGKVATRPSDVFNVRIAKNDRLVTADNEGAQYQVSYTILKKPNLDGAIVA